ncbi:MAG: M23 family metallopeptidase, partial [Candidatus Obscuribacterales bacterium]|nr:M23 family metallopeptidase [Candidatus Obscuribacterales bacterium]
SAAQTGSKNSHSAQRTIMLDESCVPRNELSKDFSDETFQARSWILPVEKPTNPKSEWVRKPYEFRFDALPGTPVRSVANGEVIYTGWYGAYGRVVLMNHGDPKKKFVYAHISKDFVQAGESVRAGQTIGLVGVSGFEYWRTWKIARFIAAQPRPKPTPGVSFLEFDR